MSKYTVAYQRQYYFHPTRRNNLLHYARHNIVFILCCRGIIITHRSPPPDIDPRAISNNYIILNIIANIVMVLRSNGDTENTAVTRCHDVSDVI